MYTEERLFKKYIIRLIATFVGLVTCAICMGYFNFGMDSLWKFQIAFMLLVVYEVYLGFVMVAILVPRYRAALIDSMPFDVVMLIKDDEEYFSELQRNLDNLREMRRNK